MAQDDNGASGFRLGLSLVERRTFKSLALGHLLFAVGLAGVFAIPVEMGNIWITPLFGLPLAVVARETRMWRRVIVLLLGLTAIHYLALVLTLSTLIEQEPGKIFPTFLPFLPGLFGGFVGSAGSLILFAMTDLTRRDTTEIKVAVGGTLLLTIIGSVGVEGIQRAMGMFPEAWMWPFLLLYTPWQLTFAYVLAKLWRAPQGPSAH